MQAIILAAGMGKRLQELTSSNTKCMVKVNGITLAERVLRQLDEMKLERIVIVVGYKGDKLKEYLNTLTDIQTKIEYIDNPIYDKTNNIYSLALAKEQLEEDDTILLESDLIFADGIIASLAADARPNLALVDKFESWMDGTVVKLDENDNIREFIPGKKFHFTEAGECYKTVNAYKFSKEFSRTHYVPFLEAYMMALGNNEYYEQVLRVITLLDDPIIQGKRLNGEKWYEIDDRQDLDIAESLFAVDAKQNMEKRFVRYGGYWRYPKMLDFCYLVNPYYPPAKLREEMQVNFDELLTQYPSGMKVNSIIAARNFSVHPENIVVGNGAAELIKAVMEKAEEDGETIGVIRPTFEEYPNRSKKATIIEFKSDNDDFSYTVDDLIGFFRGKGLDRLILINPDNPTGNYIKKAALVPLLQWTAQEQIKLIIDESFVDFSDGGESESLIDGRILTEYPHLLVMKSISKSYGVPGVRLGVAVSGDEELIAGLKKNVAIWNINSFGEFFMQIQEKYTKDYTKALEKFRAVRTQYLKQLGEIKNLRVIKTQANYVMCELTGKISAEKLTEKLLQEEDILIKDLSKKVEGNRQYIRLAIRTTEDNERLLKALRDCL